MSVLLMLSDGQYSGRVAQTTQTTMPCTTSLYAPRELPVAEVVSYSAQNITHNLSIIQHLERRKALIFFFNQCDFLTLMCPVWRKWWVVMSLLKELLLINFKQEKTKRNPSRKHILLCPKSSKKNGYMAWTYIQRKLTILD